MSPNIHRALDATETGLMIPTRALMSVSDKSGITDLAAALVQRKVEIISTGGTLAEIHKKGILARDVSEVTGFPEILDGRVKTLHPNIAGGLLAARGSAKHKEQLAENGIQPIDIVVVNFYPFEKAIAKAGCTLAEAIENIDIGGPTLARAAGKNCDGVAILTDPSDYALLIEDIIQNGGVTRELRLALMKKAFAYTAGYDRIINEYLENLG